MVWNELIALCETLLKQTKTIKGTLIFLVVAMIVGSTAIVIIISSILLLERRYLLEIISVTPVLENRITAVDYTLIKNYYESNSETIRSVNLVYYNQSVRESEIIYSYPQSVEQFLNTSRPYNVDKERHLAHFSLSCFTEESMTSCPIFHNTHYGVEGYLFVVYQPGINSSVDIRESLINLASSIGRPNIE